MANNKIWVSDSPYIEYDKEILANWTMILKQKYTIYFMLMVVLLIFLIIGINSFIVKTNTLKEKIAWIENGIEIYWVKANKIKSLTSKINKDVIISSQALLENLFFTDEKEYEIIERLRVFFDSNEIKSQLGTFNLWDVWLKIEDSWIVWWDWKSVKKVNISLTWKYQIFTWLENMITVLNRMKPIIIVTWIKFWKEGSIKIDWYTYLFEKWLFVYKYWEKYKELNKLLQKVEEYKQNKILFEWHLRWTKLQLNDKFWLETLYNCNQYEKAFKFLKIDKTEAKDIESCRKLENLVMEQKKEIDVLFDKHFNK